MLLLLRLPPNEQHTCPPGNCACDTQIYFDQPEPWLCCRHHPVTRLVTGQRGAPQQPRGAILAQLSKKQLPFKSSATPPGTGRLHPGGKTSWIAQDNSTGRKASLHTPAHPFTYHISKLSCVTSSSVYTQLTTSITVTTCQGCSHSKKLPPFSKDTWRCGGCWQVAAACPFLQRGMELRCLISKFIRPHGSLDKCNPTRASQRNGQVLPP